MTVTTYSVQKNTIKDLSAMNIAFKIDQSKHDPVLSII